VVEALLTAAVEAEVVQTLLVVTRAQVLVARVEAVQPRLMELPTQAVAVVVGMLVLAAAVQAVVVMGHIIQHQVVLAEQILEAVVVEAKLKVVELAVQVL
jgi:hypothetical protein